MSLLLDYHSSPGAAPPPYAPSNNAQPQMNRPPLVANEMPHRYYPMPRRMDGEVNGEGGYSSLFSPAESDSTVPTSFHDHPPPPSSPPAETALPQYSTGAQVRRVASHQAASALTATPNLGNGGNSDVLTSALTIRITNQPSKGNGTYYDVGDIIQGTIMFAPWKKGDEEKQEISSVTVVLQGQEVTLASGGIVCNRVFPITYHIVPDMAMPPEGAVTPGYIYSFPFSLQIPEMRQEGTGGECKCQKKHQTLPPTFPGGILDSAATTSDTARIYYQICAAVRGPLYNTTTHETKIITLCRSVFDIHVIPSYTIGQVLPESQQQVTPPVAQLEIKSRSGMNWMKSSKLQCNGILRAEMQQQQQPMCLAVDFGYSTLIPIDLSFHSLGTGNPANLPQIQRISLELLARTTYNTSRKSISLSEARIARKQPAFKIAFQRFVLSHVDMTSDNSCQWTKRVSSEGTSNDNSYGTQLNIPLTWEPTTSIPPTFESCSIERDYQFMICIHVHGVKNSLNIQVPIRILASFQPRSRLTI